MLEEPKQDLILTEIELNYHWIEDCFLSLIASHVDASPKGLEKDRT